MNFDYTLSGVFPVPIHCLYVNNFEEYRNKLIDYAYSLREKDSKGRVISNYGGWQSNLFLIRDESDIFHKFLIDIIYNLPVFKKGIGMDCFAWANINGKGDYNKEHNHPDCHLAGVLWVKAPENSGDIKFLAPQDFQTFLEIESYTEEFKESCNYYHAYTYPPKEGSLLIFPSHLSHLVEENESNDDRISFSFNIKLRDVKY